MLEMDGVSKSFGPIAALDRITFSVGPGEIVALVGENGAGKSTLARCIARAVVPDAGRIRLDGVDLTGTPGDVRRRGLSVVWQDLALCDNLDVVSNLFLGREDSGAVVLRQAAMRSRATQVFAELGVDVPDLDRPVKRLSGGQRQLVALGRATLDNPRVLILDEPTAALGIAESRTVLETIGGFREAGVAVMLVSHQLDEVFELADRIVVLRHGTQVADLHRTEAHPDDVVALITGADLDSTASLQLQRLNTLADQLSEAEESAVLPITLTALSNALNVERVGILLTAMGPSGAPVLRRAAALGFPDPLLGATAEVPFGSQGGFIGRAAAERHTVVARFPGEPASDPIEAAARRCGIAGAWVTPIPGRDGTLGAMVGFLDVSAELRGPQFQLMELFASLTGSALERGRLLAQVTNRNRTLEGIRALLETLAGPDLLQGGLATALGSLARVLGARYAAIHVLGPHGPVLHAGSDEGPSSRADERRILSHLASTPPHGKSTPDRTSSVHSQSFRWSGGEAVLSCLRQPGTRGAWPEELFDGAAKSFRLAMERELKAAAEQEAAALRRSHELQRRMIGRLSHELRTPLTAIHGFASTLLQPDVCWTPDDQSRFVSIIETESRRMGRLVADMADHSALEGGALRLRYDWCDLRLILEAARNVVTPGDDRTVLITGKPILIWADHDRIEQVFVNLLSNAIRHNPSGTLVTVRLETRGDQWNRVRISDNGVGLPPDAAAFLGGRADALAEGRGLGLRIAGGIIEAHGGCMSVEPTSEGTTLIIDFRAGQFTDGEPDPDISTPYPDDGGNAGPHHQRAQGDDDRGR